MSRQQIGLHAPTHLKTGQDPLLATEWVYAVNDPGTIPDSSPYPFSGSPTSVVVPFNAGSIVHQTDKDVNNNPQVYDSINSAGVDCIEIKLVGTYKVSITGVFPQAKTGYAAPTAFINGHVTVYDYFAPAWQPLSYPNTNMNTIMGAGGGFLIYEQLVVVNDISVPAVVRADVWQSSGAAMVGVASIAVQIFRLT